MTQTNLVGKSILGYTVCEKLGSGAFGTVYKVIKSNAAGQYVRALKHITIPTTKQYNSLLASMGGDISKTDNYFSQMLDNIISEIKILNDLSENGIQHIVRYYENDIHVTDFPKRYDIFILMEYLTPLEDFMQSTDFCVRDVIKLGLDILCGLQSCHDRGVIHRDIKDDNIFVSDKGEYKIGDFGVSKVLKDSSKAESLKGTPNFLAPEVYLGKEGYTKSVDLYSLGIVLYRLLNYNRNPFLPSFPKQYFSQDEDIAFEKRMSGKTPALPALGGEAVGRVIVKSISNSNERFQTANVFISALKKAIQQTPPEIFDKKIKFSVFSYTKSIEEPKSKQYDSTLDGTVFYFAMKDDVEDDNNLSNSKELSESVREGEITDVPKIDSFTVTYSQDDNLENTSATSQQNINNRVLNFGPPDICETSEPTKQYKKEINKFVLFFPMIVLLVGIVAYFIVIPYIYGQIISFVDWLFTDSNNIISTLRDPNIVLPQINVIIGMKIFWWVWLIGLIFSLFFMGKQLQSKRDTIALNALLKKKEPYLMVQTVIDTLNQTKAHNHNRQLDALLYSIKKLAEKLSVESDFGYGENNVISCENNIARQIQFLVDTASCLENNNLEENIKAMNTAIININSLLRKRIELKKR